MRYDVDHNHVRYVRVLDTTLRDGEQAPGVTLNPEDKLRIALALDEIGVDSIEAGFPVVSSGELRAVKMIAKEVQNAEVIALCRSNVNDIDSAIDADVDAVHIFIATSDIHLKYKLRISRDEAVRKAVEAVEYARSHGLVIEFSAEDSTRSDWNFLATLFQEVVNAGAHRIDIADTVGVMTPSRMADLVRFIRSRVRGNYLLSVHCHNDFGMATANTVSAVEAGADQVHVTVNGIGERAGNAPLEEVVAAIHFLLGYRTNVKLSRIRDVCQLVSRLTGIPIPPNKPIVGANAFSHKSGIHVAGILSNPLTYEPIPPEAVGASREIRFGKHTGRHAVEYIMRLLNVEPRDDIVNIVLNEIKSIGDRGAELSIEEAKEVVAEVLRRLGLKLGQS